MDIKPFIIFLEEYLFVGGTHKCGGQTLLPPCGLWAGLWGSNPGLRDKIFCLQSLLPGPFFGSWFQRLFFLKDLFVYYV